MDGTLELNATDSAIPAGTVALGGDQPKYDNFKLGYDNNSDDDIDDVGDDLLIDETFGSTDTSFAYDHAGNLVDDGTYRFP